MSNSLLATRIRVQLNSLVFDKTLRRKDVSGSSNTKPSSTKEEDEERKGSKGIFEVEEGDSSFRAKSQVLTLFTIDVDRVGDFAIWGFSLIDAPLEIIIGSFRTRSFFDFIADRSARHRYLLLVPNPRLGSSRRNLGRRRLPPGQSLGVVAVRGRAAKADVDERPEDIDDERGPRCCANDQVLCFRRTFRGENSQSSSVLFQSSAVPTSIAY